jgi:hypothetical protein
MSATTVLVNLAGDIGLLLWARTTWHEWSPARIWHRHATVAGTKSPPPNDDVCSGDARDRLAENSSLMATSFSSSGVIDLASGLSVKACSSTGVSAWTQ